MFKDTIKDIEAKVQIYKDLLNGNNSEELDGACHDIKEGVEDNLEAVKKAYHKALPIIKLLESYEKIMAEVKLGADPSASATARLYQVLGTATRDEYILEKLTRAKSIALRIERETVKLLGVEHKLF